MEHHRTIHLDQREEFQDLIVRSPIDRNETPPEFGMDSGDANIVFVMLWAESSIEQTAAQVSSISFRSSGGVAMLVEHAEALFMVLAFTKRGLVEIVAYAMTFAANTRRAYRDDIGLGVVPPRSCIVESDSFGRTKSFSFDNQQPVIYSV